jgi:hypothetical protein
LDPVLKQLVADCFHVVVKSEIDSSKREPKTMKRSLPIESEVSETPISPFEKEKRRFYAKVAKTCFAMEKDRYHHILKQVQKLLSPVISNQRAKERQIRVDAGIRILNELVESHMTEEYSSSSKIDRLNRLLQRATDLVDLIEADVYEPYERNGAVSELNLKELRYEVRMFYFLLNKVRAKCIGGNVGFSIGDGLGFGGGLGSSKTALGERRIALFSQFFIVEKSLCLGPSLMAGYYDCNVSRHKRVLSRGVNSGIKGKGLFCMSLGNQNDAQFLEVGVTPGYARKQIGFYGFELLSLPPDMKYFRKKLNLVASSGVLPVRLVELINHANTREDLQRIDIENYLPHK